MTGLKLCSVSLNHRSEVTMVICGICHINTKHTCTIQLKFPHMKTREHSGHKCYNTQYFALQLKFSWRCPDWRSLRYASCCVSSQRGNPSRAATRTTQQRWSLRIHIHISIKVSTYKNKTSWERHKTEKLPSNHYTTKEVNQSSRDSEKGPLTLRRPATYQLITTTKPDDPKTTPNFMLTLEPNLYFKCN
jgi:hypothetical protein